MTVDFYLYDDDGRIVMAGQCPESMLDLQRKPGLTLAKGSASHGSQYVEGGQLLDMPPRPGPQHTFDYKAKAWSLSVENAWAAVRAERDRLLTATDWRLLRAAETGVPVEVEWLEYRQALRDVTKQPDPSAIKWPTPVASMPPSGNGPS